MIVLSGCASTSVAPIPDDLCAVLPEIRAEPEDWPMSNTLALGLDKYWALGDAHGCWYYAP